MVDAIINDMSLSIIYPILLHTVVAPIAEATALQGGLGKVLFGIKVTTPKGRRLNIFHAAFRQILYLLSTIGAVVTVWINIFIYDGRLLHDRLSYSIVIKR